MNRRERKINIRISTKEMSVAKRYRKEGKMKDAIRSYRNSLKYDPANIHARIELSECYMNTGEFEEAKKRLAYIFENENILKPKKELKKRIFNILLDIEERTGNLDEQYKVCSRLESINENDLTILNKKGEIFRRNNELESSRKVYEKILKKDRHNNEALVNLGDLHFKWKNIEKARMFYEKALKDEKGNNSPVFKGRAGMGLASIRYLEYRVTKQDLYLQEAKDIAESAIDLERRYGRNNKEVYFKAAQIKSHFIEGDPVRFHIVHQYLDRAINLDMDYIEARKLRARIILDHFDSPKKSSFYFRTAARDLMKIASMKPSEENVRNAYEVVIRIDVHSAQRLKKQLDRIIFFKNRKKVFIAEVLDDQEERKRNEFWKYIRSHLRSIDDREQRKKIETITRVNQILRRKIENENRARSEISEEELKYIYLSQIMHLTLGNIEEAVDLESQLFNYPDQEHFILVDTFAYIGKIDDIIQDENSKRAKQAYDNQREYTVSNQISYNNFKPMELNSDEVGRIFDFLEGKGGGHCLSKKTPVLNLHQPRRTKRIIQKRITGNIQALDTFKGYQDTLKR